MNNEKLTYIQLVNIVDTFLRCFFLLIGGQLSRCYGRNWWNSESTVDPYRDWDRTEKMEVTFIFKLWKFV